MEEYKLAIINQEGELYTHEVDDDYHALILYEYIKTYYSDEEINHIFLTDTANVISSYLVSKGNMVFLNLTNYKKEYLNKYGKNGTYVMPNLLTEKQIETLYEFSNNTKNYDSLEIWYDFSSPIDCRRIYTSKKEQTETIIDYYITEINSNNKKNCK